MEHDHDPAYVLAAGIIFPVICVVVVSLRFYTRSKQKATCGLDDWLAFSALVCTRSTVYLMEGLSYMYSQFLVVGCGICLIVGKFNASPKIMNGLLTPILGVRLKVFGYPTPVAGLEGNPNYNTSTVTKVRIIPQVTSNSMSLCLHDSRSNMPSS